MERWDDWRLDEAWGDTDDDVSNNDDDFVRGTTKNAKTLNRSDPLSSPPALEKEETEEGKNREENIFSQQNAEEKGNIGVADEKIDDENDDVKDDAEKEKERKYYLGYEKDKRSKVLVEFWRSSFPEIKDFGLLNIMKLGAEYAKLRDCELVITMDQKLNALLPGVSVLNVLQRCPIDLRVLHLQGVETDFGDSRRALQRGLLPRRRGYRGEDAGFVVVRIRLRRKRKDVIEKLNQMCNCTDTYGGEEQADCTDAERTVAEYPELLYRLKEYDSHYDLPVSILNMLTGPNEDEILDEDYDQMWDQNMAGKSSGSNSFSNSTNSESYEEWQNDGYWEKEED